MKHELKKDVLIALMNNRRDFEIAQEKRWYRIPVKSAPENVRNWTLRFLAFYHTKIFDQEAFSVRWFGEVRGISVVRRRELLPDLQGDPKADNEYYKNELARQADPNVELRVFVERPGKRLLSNIKRHG